MKSRLVRILAPLCSVVTLATTAGAALVISDSDISAGHYVYTLNYLDTTSSTKFDNDVFTNSEVSVVQEPSLNYIGPSENSDFRTTSSFTYKFDFSTTSYLPAQLSLTENMVAFATTDPSATITSSYSVDGTTWTMLNSVTSYVDGVSSQTQAYGGTTVLDLSTLPSAVYFRVDFTADTTGFGFSNTAQWNRIDATNSNAFTADFTVVPEPSSIFLLAFGFLSAAAIRRARKGHMLAA